MDNNSEIEAMKAEIEAMKKQTAEINAYAYSLERKTAELQEIEEQMKAEIARRKAELKSVGILPQQSNNQLNSCNV